MRGDLVYIGFMKSDRELLEAILDGQKELGAGLELVEDEVKLVKGEVKLVERRLTAEIMKNRKRIDKLGLQLAELEDDAPTREEHEELERRVKRLESRFVVKG